jgi:hypothetical protein
MNDRCLILVDSLSTSLDHKLKKRAIKKIKQNSNQTRASEKKQTSRATQVKQ